MPMESIRGPIQGMETVVATVSGYHGTERSNLIKLITNAGGNYVGRMSKSITHLICWKFEGKKYDLAHKFNTIIVNHQWVEDCIKQGRRVPEDSYVLPSGQEVGSLMLEVPLFVQTSSLTRKNLLSDISDDLGSPNQNSEFTSGESGNPVWEDSSIMNKKNKLKLVEKDAKHSKKTNKRSCFDDIPLSRILSIEHKELSSHSSREARKEKRKNSDSDGVATSAECSRSRRGRRIVKNNIHEEMLDPLLSNSNHEDKHGISRPHTVAAAPSCLSVGVTNDNIQENREGSDDGSTNQSGMINVTSDGTEQIKDSNNLSTYRNLILSVEDLPPAMEQTSANVRSNVENDQVAGSTTSTELSCVICWTEFSSTRGILRCGHRFCYSCIQNWADQLGRTCTSPRETQIDYEELVCAMEHSRRKPLTCPLCKMSFAHILKVEDAASADQKVYSQTIPCGIPTSDVFILVDQESPNYGSEITACVVCRGREPEDLLVSCNVCQIRRIHTYCLDPPLFPWACSHCKDLRMLYQNR